MNHNNHANLPSLYDPFQSQNVFSSSRLNGNVSPHEIMPLDDHLLVHDSSHSAMSNERFLDGNALCGDFERMSLGNVHGSVVAGESSALRGGAVFPQGGGGGMHGHGFSQGWQCPETVGHVYSNNGDMGSGFYGIFDSLGSLCPRPRYFSDHMDYLQQRRAVDDFQSRIPSAFRPYMGDVFGVSGNGVDLRGGIGGLDHGRLMNSWVDMDRAGFPQGNRGFGVFGCDGSNLVMQEKRVNYLTDKRCVSMKGRENIMKNVIGRGANVNGHTLPWELNGDGERMIDWSALLLQSSFSGLKGYICLMAKDQSGCRFLQQMLDEGTAVNDIFNEIVVHIAELTLNPFGNYLVQKLLGMCTEEQRTMVLLKMTEVPGQLVSISLSCHGTRVVQMLIQTVRGRSQISLLKSALEPGFLDLVMDPNGNHVLQTCLKSLSNEDKAFILKSATKFCIPLATHRHGCCVLQRCIEHATGEYRENLVNKISANALHLAQDCFGNFVVQFVIKETPSAAVILNSQFQGNYVHLSMQKCSSHVVEKCLTYFDDYRSTIVHELLSVAQFDKLMQDQYANYVIKIALAVTKGRLHASLVHAIQPHKILRTSPYCKRIFSYINAKK